MEESEKKNCINQKSGNPYNNRATHKYQQTINKTLKIDHLQTNRYFSTN